MTPTHPPAPHSPHTTGGAMSSDDPNHRHDPPGAP